MSRLEVLAPGGIGEVDARTDLVRLIADALDLADGDIVVVTSKIVSKAEGLLRRGDRQDAVDEETDRVVARRGATRIVRTRHGLTLAAAGVDASNVPAGRHLVLPRDPDASARRLRAGLQEATGRTVAVLITDTAGRAWREGQVDIAIGAAGLTVMEEYAGRRDGYGNELAVTRPAVADELASAAELAEGKLGGRPVARVRGRADLVLPAGEDGPGAAALVRPEGADMFGLGAREAVVRALTGRPEDRAVFGAPASEEDLLLALRAVVGDHSLRVADSTAEQLTVEVPADHLPGLAAICFAHGWEPVPEQPQSSSSRPSSPSSVTIRRTS
ncbi:coenzyme F420-0:L-glutamate ligase [Nocardioides rotundus]|uniref:coenzyme F420-0:L-glutamate ligase n=1 Tax=Nocardioides rotundus TaxID=1774216 RepID=UPI001CC13A50|nr:coenzyme F420-0:L-glutamate ligase [Nocardioides rotundus]UAL28626.1 coenzyme F420-0:L-glutamate ligase [Nocardioides rotundus]